MRNVYAGQTAGYRQHGHMTTNEQRLAFAQALLCVARPAGVEPTTFGFGDRHSIHLSYRREGA